MAAKPRSPIPIGTRVGRWEIIGAADVFAGGSRSVCRCDCGTVRTVATHSLRRRETLSCGCFRKEKATVHGACTSGKRWPEYLVWSAMIERCHNPRSASFPFYGARGIEVCDEWRNSFQRFISDMGRRPSGRYTIERIANTAPYCRDNCRWATYAEQGRNTSRSVNLTISGTTRCLSDWAMLAGINASTISYRLKRGLSPRDAVWRPPTRRRLSSPNAATTSSSSGR